MNIYDFDDTIYSGDSFIDILKYSIIRHPIITSKSIFAGIKNLRKCKKGEVPFETVKESLLSFLFKINNREKYINTFVNKKIHKIKKWYKENKKDDDIIITASYELWIKPFCDRLGIKNVIATRTDEKGKIIGKNCKREEKINRLNKEFPNAVIKNAYSDSASDIPMFKVAEKGFVVEGEILVEYCENYNFKRKR